MDLKSIQTLTNCIDINTKIHFDFLHNKWLHVYGNCNVYLKKIQTIALTYNIDLLTGF